VDGFTAYLGGANIGFLKNELSVKVYKKAVSCPISKLDRYNLFLNNESVVGCTTMFFL
jgi:hypothetical protein